jgi:colanic acid biosynthesis glycosyl transferase WcaI
MTLRIQLWSWNYAPEPTAMGPIATLWAEMMRARGHEVRVVTGFPHYPPIWRQKWLPYRERRNGVPVLRLPLLIGHASTVRRVLEEATYAASASVAACATRRPDVAVIVSPSFLALQSTLRVLRLRRVPTILWLQDILPDAAVTTGLLENAPALRAARWLETTAYRAVNRIVVISETFRRNLVRKGVFPAKITVIYNPATRGFSDSQRAGQEARILVMGNMGYSQGLDRFVRAFEASDLSARLVIMGTGEGANGVRAEIRSSRVEFLGLVDEERVETELAEATLGLVTQRPDVAEFNLPSKLMTMMARGLPIFAFVRSGSEVEQLIQTSNGGWVVDSASPERAADALSEIFADRAELARRGAAASAFAAREFAPWRIAQRFEEVLFELVPGKSR